MILVEKKKIIKYDKNKKTTYSIEQSLIRVSPMQFHALKIVLYKYTRNSLEKNSFLVQAYYDY